MSKNMLIDSAHTEEVRVAVVNNGKLDRYDFEASSKNQVKGNIYLAKVIRVEPSLQAAFVDYGGGRHGFLSYSEIHHDYFQIPVDDRQQLEEHIHNAMAARSSEVDEPDEETEQKEISKLRYQFYKRYKIQEVIKKRQILLVQVVKEERGNKGAALTTYISLAGRYCVLMPNTAKGSGVSRKITNHNDRAKLKKIVSGLPIENGSVVIRTAGVGHTKAEIKKDFDYLVNQWKSICETTIQSTAPCMIYEEASIIKRSIRDMYSKDIDAVYVEGAEGYKTAKAFVKKLMPSHAKKVQLYDDKSQPLFSKFKINDQINQIYSPRVDLPSGGYLVINTTEALISIDVNSGKATKERNVAGTALKTNLEAAAEIARQCRLRDLAGLIVVDFIDMEEKRNNTQVERALRDALRYDKAKIQVGNISTFGLLEFSRQRLRSSIVDVNMIVCPHCNGTGFMRSHESVAIQVLRTLEEYCGSVSAAEVKVILAPSAAMYIMNHKRAFIQSIEAKGGANIVFEMSHSLVESEFKIEQTLKSAATESVCNFDSATPTAPAKKNKKKQKNTEQKEVKEPAAASAEQKTPNAQAAGNTTAENAPANKKKRRRRSKHAKNKQQAAEQTEVAVEQTEGAAVAEVSTPSDNVQAVSSPQKSARSKKKRIPIAIQTGQSTQSADGASEESAAATEGASKQDQAEKQGQQQISENSKNDHDMPKAKNVLPDLSRINIPNETHSAYPAYLHYKDQNALLLQELQNQRSFERYVQKQAYQAQEQDASSPKKNGWWQKLLKKQEPSK